MSYYSLPTNLLFLFPLSITRAIGEAVGISMPGGASPPAESERKKDIFRFRKDNNEFD